MGGGSRIVDTDVCSPEEKPPQGHDKHQFDDDDNIDIVAQLSIFKIH